MGRKWKEWVATPVADYPVAPHRYKWDGAVLSDGTQAKDPYLCDSYREAKANIPYVAGEVVYVELDAKPIKAIIIWATVERNHYGDWCEVYRIATETKAGQWSKLWERTWSGFIQRGYKAAGLAPDVKD